MKATSLEQVNADQTYIILLLWCTSMISHSYKTAAWREGDACGRWVVGTQLLAKVRGWKCHWPAVVWNVRLCLLKDMNQLLESYKEGALLTRSISLPRMIYHGGRSCCILHRVPALSRGLCADW